MGCRKKALVVLAVLGVIGLLGGAALIHYFPPYSTAERKQWKETALQSLHQRLKEPSWPQSELEKMKSLPSFEKTSPEANWLSNSLLITRQGDWLAYSHVSHQQNYRIRDLFLAKASDGKWYYSFFSFEPEMVVLRMEGQPESLDHFIHEYGLKEFDGHSDECLRLGNFGRRQAPE